MHALPLPLLQVALLSDQIEAQTDKITDLEKILDDKKDVLRKTEDVLQREMITRSSLETKKLELMSEISGLKLRQAAVERENIDLRKRLEMVMAANPQQQQPQQRQQQQHPMVDTIITLPPTGQQGQECFWIHSMDKIDFLKDRTPSISPKHVALGNRITVIRRSAATATQTRPTRRSRPSARCRGGAADRSRQITINKVR